MPARHFSRASGSSLKKQLPLGGDMTTCEAARVLHAVTEQRQRKADKPKPEDDFDFLLRGHGLPPYLRQHRFAKEALGRGWMFDFAWPKYMLAVEIEGLVMRKLKDAKTNEDVLCVYGRHATITGMRGDMEKYNAAGIIGWTVLRFEQQMVKQGDAVAETMRCLCARGWNP